jgi:hypothetical protein
MNILNSSNQKGTVMAHPDNSEFTLPPKNVG